MSRPEDPKSEKSEKHRWSEKRRRPEKRPQPEKDHRPERDGLGPLLHHPQLWRAGQLPRSPEARATGFPALDEHLPGGGWPRGALAELLLATAGIGELRLLLPLMRALSRDEARWIAWIDPPFVPYAPALEAAGVDVGKVLVIHTRNHQQALWALERASRSGNSSLALAWLDERRLTLKDTRRLQLAACRGRTLTCLFRPEQAAAIDSMAELRLAVTADGTEPPAVVVDIRKRRGGWPVQGLRLDLGEWAGTQVVREQLALWRSRHGRQETDGRDSTPHQPHHAPNTPSGSGVPRVTH